MRAGWPRFGRRQASATAVAPDNTVATVASVAAPPVWLLGAAIIASTAALLGTTEALPPTYERTYTFARNGIDGGFVELTRDQPAATFFVIVHADDLGMGEVPSTDNATALVDGTITTTGLDDGQVAPSVDVELSIPGGGGPKQAALEHFQQTQALSFTGDCDNPKTSQSCIARFAVAVSRQDQGASGGVVRFDWTFDVASKVQVQVPSQEDGSVGPFDPPWTIEVSKP
jgi:hypothetical protein